ncbi:MAG TPA: universal stress protein [Vicinamibacterales bacterium]|nr:universal stress protein [Vicinamibacterales bacterium]
MILLKTILVATDFSPASAAALTYGRELASSFGARLLVAHVAGNVLTRPYAGGDGISFVDPALQRTLEADARGRLELVLSNEDREQRRSRAIVLASNSPAAAIVEYAEEEGVDLIVLGTHGRGGVAHLLLGSVAERVVRTAPCPVLTVRHPEHEFVRSASPTPDAAA